MNLRFPIEQMEHWANLYPEEREGDAECYTIGAEARKNGVLSREQFLALCRWKTFRTGALVNANHTIEIQNHTRLAFQLTDIEDAPQELMKLKGIGLPTASTILHFCHREPFPLIDYRALWSLGIEKYSDRHWAQFVRSCRELSRHTGLSMRQVDRALWMFSRENQPVTDVTRKHNGTNKRVPQQHGTLYATSAGC